MKKLIFSTIGNDNYGDESMAINYIEKEIQDIRQAEIITIHANNIKNKYKDLKIYNPLEVIQPRNKVQKLILIIKVYISILFKFNIFKNTLKLDNNMEEYESFTMSGGGNLNSEYIDMVIQMYIISDLFKRANKKVYYRPQSIGPFNGIKGWFSKFIMKKILEMSDEFLVREEESFKLAKEIAPNINYIKKQIDDAWSLDIKENKLVNNILLTNDKKIAVCIRPWVEEDIFTKKIKEVIEVFIENNYKIIFVPISYNSSIQYSDNIFLKNFYKKNKDVFFIDDILDLNNISPKEIKYILSKVDCGIGLSYHFNVYMASLKKPCIGLYCNDYYYIKNKGFYDFINLSDNIIDINSKDAQQIFSEIISAKTV